METPASRLRTCSHHAVFAAKHHHVQHDLVVSICWSIEVVLQAAEKVTVLGVSAEDEVEAGSTTYNTFYKYWTSEEKMQYINTSMRSIRRIQNNCSLLDLCACNPSVLEKIYEGYIFDKIVRTDGLFQYMVYLPELRITNRITNVIDVGNYTGHSFKLYLFTNEIKFKSKIRLELVSSK